MSLWPADPAPRRLDPTQGPRAEIYRHFRGFSRPQFTLCGRIQVGLTGRERFGGMLWGVLAAANAVPELRQRIVVRDGEEWIEEHAQVHSTCTIATEEGGFVFCPFPHNPDRAAFLDALTPSIQAAQARGTLMPQGPLPDNLLYLSTVPWVDLSGVEHASTGDPLDCVPRIIWGRVEGGSVGVCVTAHHALVDGRHIGRFLQELERRVN